MPSLLAPAKVNLVLEVGNRRPDGFHELATLFQSVALYDRVTVDYLPGTQASMQIKGADLPADRSNLAWQAAEVLASVIGRQAAGVHIKLEKEIPIAAGLGGGSSDAAAVLLALAEVWGIDDFSLLQQAAERLGSDVPFFLQAGSAGAAALGRGRGEDLTRVALPQFWLVLANPGTVCSTRAVYNGLAMRRHQGNGFQGHLGEKCQQFMLAAQKGIAASAEHLFNDLAAEATILVPAIEQLKSSLKSLGALGVQVSGSGATVFALGENAAHVAAMAKSVSTEAAWTWWGPSIGSSQEVD